MVSPVSEIKVVARGSKLVGIALGSLMQGDCSKFEGSLRYRTRTIRPVGARNLGPFLGEKKKGDRNPQIKANSTRSSVSLIFRGKSRKVYSLCSAQLVLET